MDEILRKTTLENDFDLLSIDIDSYDWNVWHSLQNYHPKIVVIEINSSIPVGIYQTHRDNQIQGSSFLSTVKLGEEKGYVAVCHTGNLIFVRNDYIKKLMLPKEEIKYAELLFNYSWYLPKIKRPTFLRQLKRFIK